ncbi:Myc-type, basic helix-loop-helix (bHLH) domain-containing protein [Strongyloides ratti]|uniref:Myc-type, basic helix-loop-helix (BHLH) domain-containing protein n=1 Tax=Strongyloides ratti TaxID=34506 RepID=A0A090L1C8_STRRB|nr:Myc-type, basic helix-loop-helix (bHLH) domain-containing protein [Strongyloides ratti]CEF61254.1 Myc-type, basic helix-loop-helix (bHLH) domain-containing protein [Strongyloides ratti]
MTDYSNSCVTSKNDFSDDDEHYSDIQSPSSHCDDLDSEDEKTKHAREQHRALERRRRDNIKEMYAVLKNNIPVNDLDAPARTTILIRTFETIKETSQAIQEYDDDCRTLQEENEQLEEELAALEKEYLEITNESDDETQSNSNKTN